MPEYLYGFTTSPSANVLEAASAKAPSGWVDQPLPMPRMQHGADLYQWWRLPSNQIVEIRRIAGAANPECVVRNINADGEMSHGEYALSLRFIVLYGEQVKK